MTFDIKAQPMERWAVYYPNDDGVYQALYAPTEEQALAQARALIYDAQTPHVMVYDRHDGLDGVLRQLADRQSGEAALRVWSRASAMPAGRLNELAELLDELHPVRQAVDHA